MLLAAASACGGGGGAPGGGPSPSPMPSAQAIQHVVIIVQENRSVDNLFQGLPGADTANSGTTSTGKTVNLQPIGLEGAIDIQHSHTNFLNEYAGGKLYFDLGSPPNQPSTYPYAYVPATETGPYRTLAQRYSFADRMFQSNSGPSFPAHLYLIAGQSLDPASGLPPDENPTSTRVWGCDAASGTTVALLGPSGNDLRGPYPCFDYRTLADELNDAGASWRYYAPALFSSGSIWSAFDAIEHIRLSKQWSTNVISPETNILTDVPAGTLAAVTWVVPQGIDSDHAGQGGGQALGPQWVASVVNGIGRSPFWNTTAIFIVWDDWGGWFDHVVPPQADAMGLGFRVPLIVVSPYAKRGYVSHVQHEFGSILKFTEERFGLPALAASDARADDLSDCFDFTQAPQPFAPLATSVRPERFSAAPPGGPPDGD
jgi:phospholipase C